MAVAKQNILPVNGMNLDADENTIPQSQGTFIKNHINAVNNLEDGASGGQSTNALTPYPSISTNFNEALLPHLHNYTIDLSAITYPATFVSFVRDTTEVDVGNNMADVAALDAIMTGSGFTVTGVATYSISDTPYLWQKIIWRKNSLDYYQSTLFEKQADGAQNGINTCIGSYYDVKINQTIWFNYNSQNRHNIQLYNATDDTYTTVIETPLLNFSLDYRISSIDLVIAETETDSGTTATSRLLYWTDGYNEPCKINIDRAINDEYWETSNYLNYRTDNEFLRAAKPPPQTEIQDGGMETNVGNTEQTFIDSNNYQFAQNFDYRDGEHTTSSVYSTLIIVKPSTGAVIANQGIELLNIDAGSMDVKNINLYYRFGNFGEWRRFLIIKRTDYLSDSTIAQHIYTYAPTTFFYDFYNNNSYDIIDQEDFARLYDVIPIKAKSQEFLSNNIMGYGWILEGYDNIEKEQINKVTIGVTYPTAFVPNTTDYKCLKGGGVYQFGLIGYDENNRSTYIGTSEDLKLYINTQMENNGQYLQSITLNFNGMTFPKGLKKFAIARTQNTTINRTEERGFIQWALSSVEYLDDNDQAAAVGATTKVRIKIDGLDAFNATNYNQTTTTYQFAEGDRITLMTSTSGGGAVHNLINPALYGIITKQIRSTDGISLIFDNDARIDALRTAGIPLDRKDIVEIWSPSIVSGAQGNQSSKIFYEISEQIDINQSNNQSSVASYNFSAASRNPTFDNYYVVRIAYPLDNPEVALQTWTTYSESSFYSDTVVASNGEDIGRPNIVNQNAGQQWYPALVRYSYPYVQDTLINGLNRFDSARQKDYGRQSGGITRIYCNQTDFSAVILQEERASKIYIERKLIQNATGDATLVVTNEILSDAILITDSLGCQNGTAFYGRGSSIYWWDLKRGAFVGGNFERVQDISALYDQNGTAQGVQTYALKQSKAIFNNNSDRRNNKIFIHVGYDVKLKQIQFTNWLNDNDNRYYTNNQDTWATLVNNTVGFNEAGKWDGFYSFTPEMYGLCEGHRLGNAMVSYSQGIPYFHNLNNETTYLNFYGTTCDKYLEVIGNNGATTVKNIMNIAIDSKSKSLTLQGTKYEAVSVKTSNNQTSRIPLTSFEQKEGIFWSPFYRNTALGANLVTGEVLKGTWVKVKLKGDTTKNSEYNEVRSVTILFNDSKYTN